MFFRYYYLQTDSVLILVNFGLILVTFICETLSDNQMTHTLHLAAIIDVTDGKSFLHFVFPFSFASVLTST